MRRVMLVLALVILLAGAGAVAQLLRAVPALSLQPRPPNALVVPGTPPALPWPATGMAAVDVPGVGGLSSPGSDAVVPIASVAKVMVAYLILRDHPLAAGSDGPGITMTADDVAAYRAGLATGGSVVKVTAGEVLPERLALEGLLIASGNNVATALARWDAGNEDAFVAKMNAAAGQLGLPHTHYADTSGLNPATVSTTTEQVKLAETAMGDANFAAMVAKPRTTLPVAGVLTNFNTLVGRDGVVGVKTGSSNAAGGCLAIAALRPVAGHPTLVYAVVLGVKGANATQAALSAGKVLVDATGAAVGQAALLPKGQQVATVQVPWGKPVPAVTATATELPGWGGMPVTMTFHQGKLPKSLPAGARVGTLEVHVGAQRADVPIVTTAAVHPAPLRWRLRRSP